MPTAAVFALRECGLQKRLWVARPGSTRPHREGASAVLARTLQNAAHPPERVTQSTPVR